MSIFHQFLLLYCNIFAFSKQVSLKTLPRLLAIGKFGFTSNAFSSYLIDLSILILMKI